MLASHLSGSKRCTKCGETKQRTEFALHTYQGIKATRSQCRLCKAEILRAYHRNEPRRRILSGARHRSKKKGIPFDLVLDDIIIPELCPMLGIKLSRNEFGKSSGRNSPTLDRVKPALGYIRGNVQVISSMANRIKTDATVEELEKVLAYLKGNP